MCTLEERGAVYLLTLTGEGEHRLNPSICDAILSALAQVRSSSRARALVVAAEGRYFTNGFDLTWALRSPSDRVPLMSSKLLFVMSSLVSLAMPTIAAVTGHASAAGFILALAFDYRVMRTDRGFLYLSEVDIGIPITERYMRVLRSKLSPRALARMLLTGAKVTAAEGLGLGIVDRTAASAKEAVEAAVGLGEELAGRGWDGKVYASLRMAAFPEMAEGIGASAAEGMTRSKM